MLFPDNNVQIFNLAFATFALNILHCWQSMEACFMDKHIYVFILNKRYLAVKSRAVYNTLLKKHAYPSKVRNL